jgi:hypothetical protein
MISVIAFAARRIRIVRPTDSIVSKRIKPISLSCLAQATCCLLMMMSAAVTTAMNCHRAWHSRSTYKRTIASYTR